MAAAELRAEQMLKETVEMAKREKFLSTEAASEVYIDTTVQPKAITYPTDGALTNTARRMLVRLAENEGLGLKQTYRHIGKKILFSHIRAKHSKDWVTARKKLRKLRTFLGRVIRDIERKSKTLSDQMRRGIGSLDSKKRGYMPGA